MAPQKANHPNSFTHLSVSVAPLPYFAPSTRSLDFHALHAAITLIPPRSVVVLQPAAQNPTGCDPTPEQWTKLAHIFATRSHLAFFDASYPGFASGSLHTDTEAIRVFAALGVPVVLAATYGKCFGLYGERVGVLAVVAPDEKVAGRVEGWMKVMARAETGAMPAFGARIVEMILGDEESGLKKAWEEDVRGMAGQLRDRRRRLKELLETKGTPGDWSFLEQQMGMFSYVLFPHGS
ncbi:MAG: hypothetical protein Q9181_004569 [Wetmoreana brouardii]